MAAYKEGIIWIMHIIWTYYVVVFSALYMAAIFYYCIWQNGMICICSTVWILYRGYFLLRALILYKTLSLPKWKVMWYQGKIYCLISTYFLQALE